MTDKLVLEIVIPDYNAEGYKDMADEYGEDLLYWVLEDMKRDVALGLAPQPGEKCTNNDWEIQAMQGEIVGARIIEGED